MAIQYRQVRVVNPTFNPLERSCSCHKGGKPCTGSRTESLENPSPRSKMLAKKLTR